MKAVTSGQMKEIERIAIEDYNIPSVVLMENAAIGFCNSLLKIIDLSNKKICVFCGRGGNGGDGFAIARHLKNMSCNVSCVIGFDERNAEAALSKDAYINYRIASNMEIEIIPFEEMNENYDLLIDALLGTGLKDAPKKPESDLIKAINESASCVVSVDIPSGADASGGKVFGDCVRADFTITFCCEKVGHYLYPCKEYVGKLLTVPISIPKTIVDGLSTGFSILDDDIYSHLPRRYDNSHKGDFGKILAFVGSDGMTGAALLSVSSAFKSGVGMVTVASSKEVLNSLVLSIPEAMTLPLEEKDGEALLSEALLKNDVLLLGCGIGRSAQAEKLTHKLIETSQKPMVIDADAINHLSKKVDILKNKKAPAILTPHLVEFSRMTGIDKKQIEENKLELALTFSKKYDVFLVLKNADTLVTTPDGVAYICPVSNSGLATAGSGDVLAGIIAGLLAQGASPEVAASAGVYIHSASGALAKERKGERSMTASDIISGLPELLKKIN